MKIERTDNLKHPVPGGKKPTPGATGERFGEILQNTVSGVMAATEPRTLQDIPPAGGFAGFIPSADRKDLAGRADQLLNLLESYQKKLENPGTQVKEAYSSMKAIEDQADELTPYIESLPENDEFRDFLNRLVITASVEAIKFRRGDYL
jgi:hypothetical protein